MPECPICGLFNPPEAMRCDCGYDFADRQVGKQALDVAWKINVMTGFGMLLLGSILLAAGVALAIAADVKNRLLIWGGGAMLVFGLIQFVPGLRQRRQLRTGHHL